MRNPCLPTFLLLSLSLIASILLLAQNGRFAEATKRRIHVSDDLDDVIDDEEDDDWKLWGKKKSDDKFDPPPTDFSGMQLSDVQEEIFKRQTGPAFGFVKLRLGVRRTPDTVAEIAMKWTKVLRTGALETNFMGFDTATIMFTMEKGQDARELKDFVLSQPEAYEIKVGDQVFRRPGDPPLEEVIEQLRKEKEKAGNSNPSGDGSHHQNNEEL